MMQPENGMVVKYRTIWAVDASAPPLEKQPWKQNIRVTVCATSALDALTIFQSAYPTAEVHALRKEGVNLMQVSA